MTYRGVDEALVVHCQVEFGLDALDGHNTEPHGDQVEHSYGYTHIYTRTRSDTEGNRTILINITDIMTPPFCSRDAVINVQSGTEAIMRLDLGKQ